MLEHIFLDLDDTLLDFTRAEAIALTKALTEMDVPTQQAVLDRYHVINQRQWELLEEGVLTRAEVLVSRFEILFRELGLVRDPAETCQRYEGHLAEGHIFLPGAPELLAIAAVVLLHRWKGNVLLSIAGGTALYMLLVQAVFA